MNTDKTQPSFPERFRLPHLRIRGTGSLFLGVIALALVLAPGEGLAGGLTQLGLPDACVAENGGEGRCADGVGLRGPHGVAVSPDGRHVYVVSSAGNSIAAFAADRKTGAVTQLPGLGACISEDGSGGDCADGVALGGASAVAVSPDGKHVYVASLQAGAVGAFARDKKTGVLTQLPGLAACVSEDGSGGACADGVALEGAISVAISPDGRHVYVAAKGAQAVAVFSRKKTTGALIQLPGLAGCVSETGSFGACTDGVGLHGAFAVAVSPDGRHVYVAAFDGNAIAAFARSKTTGALTQLPGLAACVSETGSGGACADGVALGQAYELTVSPDGKNVYLVSLQSNAVAAFARNKTTGALTQLPGLAACVSGDGTGGACTDGVALHTPLSVALGKGGRHAYVASYGEDAVAVFRRDR